MTAGLLGAATALAIALWLCLFSNMAEERQNLLAAGLAMVLVTIVAILGAGLGKLIEVIFS